MRIIPFNIDIIPVAGRSDLAISYDFSTWTNVAYGVGQTAFTCHTQVLGGAYTNLPFAKAHNVTFRSVLGGTGQVNLVSFYYDANNQPVWKRDWITPLQCRPAYNPDNQGAYITDAFNEIVGADEATHQFTLEMLGSGTVYMGRLEILFEIPEATDPAVES